MKYSRNIQNITLNHILFTIYYILFLFIPVCLLTLSTISSEITEARLYNLFLLLFFIVIGTWKELKKSFPNSTQLSIVFIIVPIIHTLLYSLWLKISILEMMMYSSVTLLVTHLLIAPYLGVYAEYKRLQRRKNFSAVHRPRLLFGALLHTVTWGIAIPYVFNPTTSILQSIFLNFGWFVLHIVIYSIWQTWSKYGELKRI